MTFLSIHCLNTLLVNHDFRRLVLGLKIRGFPKPSREFCSLDFTCDLDVAASAPKPNFKRAELAQTTLRLPEPGYYPEAPPVMLDDEKDAYTKQLLQRLNQLEREREGITIKNSL